VQLLKEFAIQNSAEERMTEAAQFIENTTPDNFKSLRITETPYWKAEHAGIYASVWKTRQVSDYGECESFHFDALKGTFENDAISLPHLKEKLMKLDLVRLS